MYDWYSRLMYFNELCFCPEIDSFPLLFVVLLIMNFPLQCLGCSWTWWPLSCQCPCRSDHCGKQPCSRCPRLQSYFVGTRVWSETRDDRNSCSHYHQCNWNSQLIQQDFATGSSFGQRIQSQQSDDTVLRPYVLVCGNQRYDHCFCQENIYSCLASDM